MTATGPQGETPPDELDVFIAQAEYLVFEQFCRALLVAENVVLDVGYKPAKHDIANILDLPDVLGKVTLIEPGGSHRTEIWAFDFRLYRQQRVGIDQIAKAESYRQHASPTPDIVCIVTSGEVTSVFRKKSNAVPWLRVWDRSVVKNLVQRHPQVLAGYRQPQPDNAVYGSAVLAATVTTKLVGTVKSAAAVFRDRLLSIPPGLKSFAEYESAVADVLKLLFDGQLGDPKKQNRTLDGAQRRDVLLKNRRQGEFWTRIFDRFGADFLIVDAKNYGDPIGPSVLDEVAKYANKAVGRFVLIVSRRGADPVCQAEQIRILRDRDTMVVCISDEQLIEMLHRKRAGEAPEDVLEDALDAVLLNF